MPLRRSEFDARFAWAASSAANSDDGDDLDFDFDSDAEASSVHSHNRAYGHSGGGAVLECEAYMRLAAERFRGVYDVQCYLAMSKLMDLADIDAIARGWRQHYRGQARLLRAGAADAPQRAGGEDQGAAQSLRALVRARAQASGAQRLLLGLEPLHSSIGSSSSSSSNNISSDSSNGGASELYLVGIREDALIPVEEMAALAEALGPRHAPRLQFDTVRSAHGHDAFLTQPEAFRQGLARFFDPALASGVDAVRSYAKSVEM